MAAPPPPLPLPSQYGPYGVFVGQAEPHTTSLEPGERVGGPPRRRRRRLLRIIPLVMLLGGGGWYVRDNTEQVTALVSQATALLDDLRQAQRQLPQRAADAPEKVAEPLSRAEHEIAAAERPVDQISPDKPAPPEPKSEPETVDAEAAPVKTQAIERLPTVVADPADPLQQKALAAGLHPALSRTLLAQLTAEDFRNAAHAVSVALKGEKNADPFVWPRQRLAKRAQFKISLVEGAPLECRRYVVKVAKDGWETTARPMERCGTAQAFKPS